MNEVVIPFFRFGKVEVIDPVFKRIHFLKNLFEVNLIVLNKSKIMRRKFKKKRTYNISKID